MPRSQAKGKEFVQVRWIDLDKGDATQPNVRCRLVAKDFRWRNPGLENTFASTPPLEALRYCLSELVTVRRRAGRRVEVVMMVLDVSRAHFHPFIKREL